MNIQLFTKKLAAGALILSVILPQLALAQVGNNSASSLSNAVSQARQKLSDQRSEVEQNLSVCDPTQRGPMGKNAAIKLQSVLSRSIQQSLAQTLNQTLTQNLANIVNQQLSQNLSGVIERGLSQDLPRVLRDKLSRVPAGERNTRGPALLQESVRELLPGILQNGVPQMLQDGVGKELKHQLGQQLIANMPAILQASGAYVEQLQAMVGQLVGNISGSNLDPGSIINAVIGITTAQANLLQTVITSAIGEQAGYGAANGQGMDRLVDQMMPVIIKRIMGSNGQPGMIQHFGGASNSSVDAFGLGGFQNASQGFDFNAWAGNNVTAAIGFDLSPVSQAIAHPLSLSLVSGLGPTGYDGALGNLALMGYQGEPTVSALQGANALTPEAVDYAYRVGYQGPMNADVASGLNAAAQSGAAGYGSYPAYDSLDFSTGGIADGLGSDAVANIDPNSIASNSISNLGLGEQLGASLTGGLVNGLSSGIGGLVDGIPYVGGLLSPIAEDLVQTTLYSLLGTELYPAWATQDRGVQQTVANGFKHTLNLESKSEAHLKQANKQLDRDYKEQTQQKSVLVSTCMKNYSAVNTFYRIEDKLSIQDPAASANSQRMLVDFVKKWQTAKSSLATNRFAGQGGEGQTTTPDYKNDPSDAAKEAVRKVAVGINQNNDPDLQKIATDLTKSTYDYSLSLPTMPYSERQNFLNNGKNLSTADYLIQKAKYVEQGNDLLSLQRKAFDRATNEAAKAEQAEAAELAANKSRSIKACDSWTTDLAGNPLCNNLVTKVSGAVISFRDQLFAVADILKTLLANQQTEENTQPLAYVTGQLLTNGQVTGDQIQEISYDPWNPQTGADGYQASQGGGYVNTGLISQFGFGPAFSDSLNQVMTSSIQNLGSEASGWTSSQISGLTSNLTSGLESGGFYPGEFDGQPHLERDQALTTMVTQALQQSNLSDATSIINAIVQLIIEQLTKLAQNTPTQ